MFGQTSYSFCAWLPNGFFRLFLSAIQRHILRDNSKGYSKQLNGEAVAEGQEHVGNVYENFHTTFKLEVIKAKTHC